jgi:arabinofuranosyltransferase
VVYAVVVAWLVLAAIVVLTWGRLDTDRGWRGFVLALTLGLSLLHQLLFATVTEDALITFRYAQNIADGNGPVFNPGERVEGYTNFLWLVLIALPRAAFGADVETAAVVFGVLSALGCVLVSCFLVNRIVAAAAAATPSGTEPRPALGVAAAVLTASAGGLAVYGPSGSEVPLFVLLVLSLGYALAARRPVVAGVLVALAVMTSPEGLVVAVLAGLWLVGAALKEKHSWWAPVGYVLGALVFLIPRLAWRATFYQHFLPAPLAAKLGAPLGAQLDTGWPYVSGFALAHQGFLLLGLVAAVALLLRRTEPAEAVTTGASPPAGGSATWNPRNATVTTGASPQTGGSATHPRNAIVEARALIWLLFVTAAALAVAAVLVGGDPGPSWRLLAPVPPLLAVASAAAFGVLTVGAEGKPSPRPRSPATRLVPVTACGLAGIAILVSVFSPEMLDRVRDWRAHGTQLAEIGGWLGKYLPPGSVVSAAAPGAFAIHGGQLLIIDVLGRTDDHIAREGRHEGGVSTDYDYVVNARRPTVAVPADGGYADRQHCAIDPVYAGKYEVATFRRVGTPYWVSVYPRAEQAKALVAGLDKGPDFRYVPCPS